MATNEASPRPLRGGRHAAPLLAYVLHHYDWSETSLIVELFTRAQGRVVVAAKGAKRPTSQLRPVLLPFQPVHAHLGKTPADEQAEVHTLRSAEWAGGMPLLGAGAMFPGFYLNELLLKLLARQDPHPVLFDAYADTLAALATQADEAATLRAFELMLLREIGVLPELVTATLTAQAVQPGAGYMLHAEAGLMADAQGLPGATWVALEAALGHVRATGHAAALRAACAPVAAALRGPLRALLHYHLGHAPLRTRQVWQGVQRLADTTPR
jgi:DNA repair protein RecO (recombination protein O)